MNQKPSFYIQCTCNIMLCIAWVDPALSVCQLHFFMGSEFSRHPLVRRRSTYSCYSTVNEINSSCKHMSEISRCNQILCEAVCKPPDRLRIAHKIFQTLAECSAIADWSASVWAIFMELFRWSSCTPKRVFVMKNVAQFIQSFTWG